MTEPTPDEANEADRVEQDTPVDEPGAPVNPQPTAPATSEADDGDLAESAIEVPYDEDDDRR